MPLSDEDARFLAVAIEEAKAGWHEGGIPIGAALVVDGEVLGRGHNLRVQQGNPILHGETSAMQAAGRQPAAVYARSTMYTTLSPCAMCSGTVLLYGIPRVVIAENSTFLGEEELLRSRGVEVVVADPSHPLAQECVGLMQRMIDEKPSLWNEDIGVED